MAISANAQLSQFNSQKIDKPVKQPFNTVYTIASVAGGLLLLGFVILIVIYRRKNKKDTEA